jgi:type II secretory ATPase GspE/PulE/Tfp pilus assembly ATPase PilB-like protein
MNSGYKGRLGVYEMLRATPSIRDLIDQSAPISEIEALARREGTRPMLDDGINKALLGLTTVAELNKLHATIEITPETGEIRQAA